MIRHDGRSAVADSPSITDARNYQQIFATNGQLQAFPDEPYVIEDVRLLDLADVELPDQVAEGLPLGAQGLVVETSAGRMVSADRDTGDETRELRAGWHGTDLAILIPTGLGWRIWDWVTDFTDGTR